MLGVLWAGTAQASIIDNIIGWFSPNNTVVANNDSSNYVVASSSPIIPSINLNKLPPTIKMVILPTDYDSRTAGQCVGYVRYMTGVTYSGNAIAWKNYINSDKPVVGSIVVMQASKWGHVGLIKEIKGDKIVIRSRNWEGLWKITDNEFDITDSRLLGYIIF